MLGVFRYVNALDAKKEREKQFQSKAGPKGRVQTGATQVC